MIRCLGVLLLFLCAPAFPLAEEAPTPLPPNYRVVLDDSSAKVIRVHYGPHEKIPVHTHPETPTVYVYLNDGPAVRFTHYEDPPSSLVRPATHKGTFRVSPGRLERHAAENLGDTASDYLRVELPGLRLGEKDLEFRGQAPSDFSHTSSVTEFASPVLSIARTICVGLTPCAIAPSPARSVVIAFSDVELVDTGQPSLRVRMDPGDVIALRPHESVTVAGEADSVAHILEINLKAAVPAPH